MYVVNIQRQTFRPIELIATAHLRQPGDTWADLESFVLIAHESIPIVEWERSWTDERELAPALQYEQGAMATAAQ